MRNNLFLILILIVFLNACGKKSIVRKYYLLEFKQDPKIENINRAIVDEGCEIYPVQVPPAFAQSRIAVRLRSHEINYYYNHQWAVAPGDILTKIIEKYVQEEHIFKKASQTVWQIVPQYQVLSEVFQIEAVDINDELHAHLSMKLNLYDRSENRIIISHSFDRMDILEERDINLLAISLSNFLKEELHQFTYKIKKYLTGNLNSKIE